MRKHDAILVALALAVFVWPVAIHAQAPPSQITSSNDTGVKPYAPYGGVRENISLTNGNLNLQIPLVNLPGRKGNNVALNLIYDSKFWVLHGGYDETMNVAEYWWQWENMGAGGGPSGWRLNLPRISPGPYQFSGGYTACYTGAIVSLFDGSKHSFRNRVGCSPPSAGLAVTDSEDNTFLRLDTSYEDNIVLHMKDGTRIYFPSIESQANKIVDPDGNVTTIQQVSGETTITDTLGRQVTINSAGVTYKDSGGVQRTIAFNYTLLNLAPTFTEPRERSLPNPTQVVVHKPAPGDYALLTSVVLLNNRTYLFQYNTFGELTQITYPTGGYTKYNYSRYVIEWESYPNSADFREVTERRVCANTSGICDPVTEEKVTTYTPSILGNQNQYMNLVDADGNLTRHQFALGIWGGWASRYNATVEIKKWIYQGQSTLLRTIETQYNQLGYGGSPQSYSLPISVTTTLNDSNQVSRVEYTYDTYAAQIITPGEGSEWLGVTPTARSIDNPTEVREYDYGIGAPGGLARRTVNTWLKINPINSQDYHSIAIHILDRKASEAVYDGAGTLKAQSQFEYDSYAEGIMASGAVQHEPSFNTGYTFRGNLTTSKRWRNIDGALLETRHMQFDDAGNILKSKDPGQHITQFSYADAWANAACQPAGGSASAYLTSITNALGHIASSTYNSCAGTAAASTDPNGQTTDFAYDLMNRLVRTTLPPDGQGNRGQTAVTFNEPALPLSVTTTTKITPSMNLVSTVTVDGLGRESFSSLDSDPQGVTRTKTEYDALGRKKRVYNPTRCNPPESNCGESTWGYTTFEYDALGRTTKVIPPDGTTSVNNITTAYSGTTVTVTDQAGKQRRSYTDALGRLIQVDEPGGGGPGLPGSGSATVSGTLQGTGGSATPGTGSATVNGSEQVIQGTGATPGTGSVNITGSEQSWGEWIYLYDECVLYGDEGCLQWHSVYTWVDYYDYGGVSITVNGASKSVSYVSNSTGNSIGTALANAINGDSNYPVTASVNGTIVNLTSKATGTASNYSLSATSWTDDPGHFSGPSFVPVRSGPTLTGGTNSTSTVYDSGSVWVTVNGSTKTVTYGQGSTNTSVATALRDAINGDGNYPVSASLSGPTINLTARTTGASTNYSLSGGSSTSQPGSFSQPSFTVSVSGANLTGGANGSPFDSGNVSVTVTGGPVSPFAAQVTYSQGSTSASVASALASALNAANSPVTASTNGPVVSITAKAIGSSSNYTLSSSSSSTVYPSPSFTVTTNGLSGGADYTPGTLAAPAITLYTYDTLDNLTNVAQSGSRPRTFTYNSLSQLLSAANPESGTICYGTVSGQCLTDGYDPDGNLIKKTDARGVSTTFSYDALHRLTTKSYSDGTPTSTNVYDVVTSGIQVGNMLGRLSKSCWEGSYSNCDYFAYDAMGRTTIHEQGGGGIWQYAIRTYGLAGQVTALTYQEAYSGRIRSLAYGYDSAGRVNQVRETTGAQKIYSDNITYSPHGAVSSLSLSNGAMQQTAQYNARLQPASLTVTKVSPPSSVMNFTYTFTNASGQNNGNVVAMSDAVQNLTYGFQYDELNRLARAETTNTNLWGNAYSYDIWGNLHAKNQIAGQQQGEYFQQTMNAQNQFAGWSYDAAGNLLNDGLHSYAYDAENLIKTMDGGVGSYVYSAQGRRVKKAVNGVTTQYANDGPEGPVVTEFVGGAWSKDYIYLNGALLATESTTEGTRFHFSDHLGTPRVITDAVGTVISRHDYYPFGREITPWSDNETHKFTGKERDTESGLDFFIARYYSSQYGRFLSPDEFAGGPVDAFSSSDPLPPGPLPYADITNPQSLNKYAYTYNNPLNYVDPNGHDVKDFILGVVNAVGSNGLLGAGRQEAYNTDHADGQALGDAISVVAGAIETALGAGVEAGGIALDLTGIGAIAGVPANIAGAAIMAHGAGMSASGGIHLAKSTDQGGKRGEIYVSEPQESGKPYVGRTTQGTDKRMATRTDGRTGKAKVVDKYDAKNTKQGRFKEQKQMDRRGGIKKLDNQRREVSKKNMDKLKKEFEK